MDAAGGAQAAPQDRAQQLHMQKFCPENVAHNAKQLYYIRSIVSSVAGATAGIFGLVNFHGFYFYLVCTAVTNLLIYTINVRLQPKRYLINFNTPAAATETSTERKPALFSSPFFRFLGFLTDGLQEMAFGYVLWWTLWTALIHVYD